MSGRNTSIREVPNAAGPIGGFLLDMSRAVRSLSSTAVRRSDLVKLGLAAQSSSGNLVPTVAPPDFPTPPQPTGTTYTSAIVNVLVTLGATNYPGHDHAELLRADTNDFSAAQVVLRINGTTASYPVGPSNTGYYWVRYVNRSGVTGPADTQTGTLVTTGQDVSLLLDALTEAAQNPLAPYVKLAVRASLFYVADPDTETDEPVFSVVTTPVEEGGVEVPPGVYIADAFIKNGTITNAKIANAAIDDAKIANLSADKINAGTISADRIAAESITTEKLQVGSATVAASSARFNNTFSLSAANPEVIQKEDFIELESTGAPVTVVIRVGCSMYVDNSTVAHFKSTTYALIDGADPYPVYLTDASIVRGGLYNTGVMGAPNVREASFEHSLVYRITPPAGVHTYGFRTEIFVYDGSGNAINVSTGNISYFASGVATENKV